MRELFSVVVVTYNHEKYVAECLDSVSHQSYSPVELIVIDDLSSDETREVVDSWIEKNSSRFQNVSFIKNSQRLGVSATHTKGVKKCSGSLVKYISGDDILIFNSLERIADFTRKLPDFYFGFGLVQPFYDDTITGRRVSLPTIPQKRFLKDYGRDPDRQFKKLALLDYIPAPGTFFSYKALESIDYFDLEFTRTEDWHTWLKFTLKGMNYALMREPVAMWRRHSESLSAKSSITPDSQFIANQVKVIEKYILPNIKKFNYLERYHILLDKAYRERLVASLNRPYNRVLAKALLAIDPLMWRRIVEILFNSSKKYLS